MTAPSEAIAPLHDPPCPLLLIVGPTASGKSALAIRLARETGGEIVNADSMQVYRDLRVLTARPSPDEEALAAHHLFGVVDGAETWSVGHWLRAIGDVLTEIATRGRSAIVVGGTGLYFRALTQGLADAPPVSDSARAATARHLADVGESAFRTALARVDPAAEARISPGDVQRLVRAMAVYDVSGKGLSDWQRTTVPILRPGAWRGVAIAPPRETLYERCDSRLKRMIAEGALHEVAALAARGLDPGLPVMKALGVAPLAAQLRGEMSAIDALARARADTRRYAKRQITWLRHQAQSWPRIEAAGPDAQWDALTRWVFHAPSPALTSPRRDGMT